MIEPVPLEFAISCGVYLRGDDLDPDAVTSRLGIVPTSARRMGELRKTSAGTPIRDRSGLWSRVVHADASEFEPAIAQALSAFDAIGFDLCGLPGVDDAFFDIFGIGDAKTELGHGGWFSLSARQVARIAELGLSVHVHISIFDPDEPPEVRGGI